MKKIVALDIETTGLDPKNDSIIEIGAVRFTPRRIEDEWTTLINPGRRISPFITRLTGITDQMVLHAPPIHDMLDELVDFIGNSPVVGHNVGFDLSFLNRLGILNNNERIDTYEIASVLLPNAGRYNLASLAQALAVPYPASHRALDDAKTTYGVFQRLYEEALSLPYSLVEEILILCEEVDWAGSWVFKQIREKISEESNSNQPSIFESLPFVDLKETSINFDLIDELIPIDIEEAASTLEPGGAFAKNFPNFEFRPQQVAMLKAVAEGISEHHHLLVEAGTGIGKSIAYLIPAAIWSTMNNQRVVISTNTINLQDQLINKDIPDLKHVLGMDINASVLKGRANYLCPRRFKNFKQRGPENTTEMRILAKILVWRLKNKTGDRSEINLNGPEERRVWSRFSAEDEYCTSDNCLKFTDGKCPFYLAYKNAQHAHILVVNHALLLADVATGYRVLPEYDFLIIDEAHHLEDAL